MLLLRHTNGANDGGAAEVLRRHHLGVELGVPLQLHAVAQVVEGVGGSHFDVINDCWIKMEKGKVVLIN